MPLFKLTKSQSCFFTEIDAQHRNLYLLANELHRAMLGGAENSRILEALRALIAAAEEHFAFEERLMRSTRYSAYAWHKQQHDTVRKRANQFVPQIENLDPAAAPLLI